MRLALHPKVYSDIDAVMSYYEQIAGSELAREFYRELRGTFNWVIARPESYSIRQRDLRRANLQRFPYHILFRVTADSVRVLVVRHHSRHPSFGRSRR